MNVQEYHFEMLLGKGTFGSVYLVRRKKDFKAFVLKEQHLNAENTSTFQRIMDEIGCLQKVRHPNVITYYAGWTQESYSYIMMEYATRGTIKSLLEKRSTPLTEDDALYLFSQITLGVHHIHSRKILHRDIKPENIMLTGRCGDIVKIGDFGVSKNVKDEPMVSRAGSFYYMAPEMILDQPYNFKIDIWSMGVVLYEMVTKKLPFPATNLKEIAHMVVNEKPRAFEVHVSSPLNNMISKMLRRQAVERPRTDQLMLCPHLVPHIIKVYLNLGRAPDIADRELANLTLQFYNFLGPRVTTHL